MPGEDLGCVGFGVPVGTCLCRSGALEKGQGWRCISVSLKHNVCLLSGAHQELVAFLHVSLISLPQ